MAATKARSAMVRSLLRLQSRRTTQKAMKTMQRFDLPQTVDPTATVNTEPSSVPLPPGSRRVRGKNAVRRPTRPKRDRHSSTSAAHRSSLPATLPRPVKLTRDRTYTVPPPAHIRVLGVEMQDHDRDTIAQRLGMKLGKFASSIERITVRLSDANGPKGGRDQICKIKVVLSGLPSIVVEEKASMLPEAIDRAMQATALAVRRRIQRRRLKALHHRASPPLISAAS
jgi:hypothetical protein